MIAETIKLDWALLGAKLACLSSEAQGQFFTGFAFELGRYESGYKRQLQMGFIQDNLSKEHQRILEDALPSLWFQGKEATT